MPEKKFERRLFIRQAGACGAWLLAPVSHSIGQEAASKEVTLSQLKAGWADPPRDFRPRTRWWWPGSAVSREGITRQLSEMHAGGLGGVEIISSWQWYEKGNLSYISDEYFAMVRFACEQAKRLGMQVALTFGAGWDFGGFWVPVEERSKCLTAAWVDVNGGERFDVPLPAYKPARAQNTAGHVLDGKSPWEAPDENLLIAAVAMKREGDRLDGTSAVVLTSQVRDNRLAWTPPAGRWQIGTFRLKYTGQPNSAQNFEPLNYCVDHFSRKAMRNYVEHLGGIMKKNLGTYFGQTIDSFFADSFEVVPLPGGVLWSNDTLAAFNERKGYDLTPFLPALWQDVGELTPRIRYDVNEFLHQLGKETYYGFFGDWCKANNVEARIQPHYRFTTELIEGAGLAHRPETEVCTARFETIADPRKATASGARFYGREIVSAEAYTFLHQERYRSTLEEMKRATDAYFRDGVTQLYNHGWVYTEETDVVPSRDMPWANRISPWTPWWPYYKHLAAYISRCCYLLRQGRLVADVLIYSPQATVWSERVIFGNERRIMPYGDLPKTLVANGYDYDLVNDDLLQKQAAIERGHIMIRGHIYRALILPRATVMPLATLQFARRFASAGGVVIALEDLPGQSAGLQNHDVTDAAVRDEARALFSEGRPNVHYLAAYKLVAPVFNPQEQPWKPTPVLTAPQRELLAILRRAAAPDLALENGTQSDGLAFLHKVVGSTDIYFIANLQPQAFRQVVTIRTMGKRLERWDPLAGETSIPVLQYERDGRCAMALDLAPWESAFFIAAPGTAPARVSELREIASLPPLEVQGEWRLSLSGVRFPKLEKRLRQLASWTEAEDMRHCSGTGIYEIEFDLPAVYAQKGRSLLLDLGGVGDVADVKLNGQAVGVRFMQPYRLDVTKAARSGANKLLVSVTNTLHNHVAGLPHPPPVPAELVTRFGRESNRYPQGKTSFENRDAKFRPLTPSGLLGPVRILALQPS